MRRSAGAALIVVGDDDAPTPRELWDLRVAVAHARRVVLPDCGRMITLERPREVTWVLVERVSGGGSPAGRRIAPVAGRRA